jgi:hypothetical protein
VSTPFALLLFLSGVLAGLLLALAFLWLVVHKLRRGSWIPWRRGA